MTQQDRERALMIVADAHLEASTGLGMSPESGKLDRIYGYIASNGDMKRYRDYLGAQVRALRGNRAEWNTPESVIEDYAISLQYAANMARIREIESLVSGAL